MDFVLLLLKVFFYGFIALWLLCYVAKFLSFAFSVALDFVSDVLGKWLLLFLFPFSLVLLLLGIAFRDKTLMLIGIIALLLTLMYANRDFGTTIQSSGNDSKHNHRKPTGFSKVLVGLGLGYLAFGNRNSQDSTPIFDDLPDDRKHDDFCLEDIEPDADLPTDFDDNIPDD